MKLNHSLFLLFTFTLTIVSVSLAETVKVKRVIDGDTFHAEHNQDEFHVRLLYINTPESVHRDKKQNIPMGKVASEWLQEKIEGKEVVLERAIGADSLDRFQRRLALVYLNDEFINLRIVEEGLSPYYTKYGKAKEPLHSKFVSAEKKSRELKKGIWSDPELTKTYLRLKSKWGQDESKSKKKSTKKKMTSKEKKKKVK